MQYSVCVNGLPLLRAVGVVFVLPVAFYSLAVTLCGQQEPTCCQLSKTYYGEMRAEFDVGMMMSIYERNTIKIQAMIFH